MSSNPNWRDVKPLVEKEMESIRQALTDAPSDIIVRLQARHRALKDVCKWFGDDDRANKRMFPDP